MPPTVLLARLRLRNPNITLRTWGAPRKLTQFELQYIERINQRLVAMRKAHWEAL